MSSDAKATPPTGGNWPLRLAVTLAAMAILAIRKSDSFTNPQLWAEDGGVFLIEAELHGWSVLFKPYEGYLHVLPRLVAALGLGLPLASVPVFYAGIALLFTGLTAWTIQSPRIHLPGAWAAALAIAAIPHTGEVYLTLCNLQWIIALALFALAIMDDATTPSRRAGDIALLLVTGLTGPFIVLALPLFLWRAWQRRSGWSFLLLGLAVGCALAHAPSLLHRAPPTEVREWAPLQHFAVIGRRLWVSLFAGGASPGVVASAVLAVVLPAGFAWAIWRRRLKLPGAGLLLATAIVVLAATGYKARFDTWSFDDLVNGDRYFYVSKILFLWLLAALALTSTGALRVALGCALLVPYVANARRFTFPPFPEQDWRRYATEIERGQPTMVPILPEGFKFWHPGRRPR